MPRDAREVYSNFRGRAPGRDTRIGVRFGQEWLTDPARANLWIPKSLAVIGHVQAISYDTTRDGETLLLKHTFHAGARPLFAVGAEKGQLFLIGNTYRFTSRGIVDYDEHGHELPD